MKGFYAMQYLRNLCITANTHFESLQFAQDTQASGIPALLVNLQLSYDSIKAACAMAKINGLLVAVSRDGVSGSFAFITVWDKETDETFTGWIPRNEDETDVYDYDQMKRESYICFATSLHGTYGRIESTYPHLYNAFDSYDLAWIFTRKELY